MNQIFKTALSGELNRTMRGIGTIYKTALSEIRVEWNRVKRGVPVLKKYSLHGHIWKCINFLSFQF